LGIGGQVEEAEESRMRKKTKEWGTNIRFRRKPFRRLLAWGVLNASQTRAKRFGDSKRWWSLKGQGLVRSDREPDLEKRKGKPETLRINDPLFKARKKEPKCALGTRPNTGQKLRQLQDSTEEGPFATG